MIVLLNLALTGLACTPIVIGLLGWKYFASPEAVHARKAKGLANRIAEAVEVGDFTKAHALAYALTALSRRMDPNAAEYRVPVMKSFYDSMSGSGGDKP